MKINSFKLKFKKIFLIKEEIKKLNDIYIDLIPILRKINPETKFIEIFKKNFKNNSTIKILTLFPVNSDKKKTYFHLLIDRGDMSGRFNFYKEFLENNNFDYKINFFFNSIKKLRHNWSNKKRIKKLTFFLKIVIFFKTINFSKIKKLITLIKFKDGIKYNFESLNHSFCYKKPVEFEKNFKFVLRNLSDNNSKENYQNFYYGNFERNFKKFFFEHLNNFQYSDYINLKKESIILNCGVRAGFEIPLYLSQNVKRIYNIDPSGSKYLDPYVIKNIELKKKTKLIFIKRALYLTDSVYGISKKNLQTTTLKKIINDFNIKKVDLIKSDIEGGERIMVNELIDICLKFKPQLSISIYHDNLDKKKFILDDGVEIPKKLIENLKDYKYYFKHYSFDKNESIFYAIPNKAI
jgi:hypothetical protein